MTMGAHVPQTHAQPLPAEQDVDSMSVKDLKQLITAAGLTYADGTEKSDLQARAREALGRSSPHSSSASGEIPCPPGYDPEVWSSLPVELQREMLGGMSGATMGGSGTGGAPPGIQQIIETLLSDPGCPIPREILQKAKGDPNVTTVDELRDFAAEQLRASGTATSTAPASRPSTADKVVSPSLPRLLPFSFF